MEDKRFQVFAITDSTGMTVAESNEHQRKWDDDMWNKKEHSDGANYDHTRSKLNFEIAKGCIVQPIDTSKSIPQRMEETLAERGIVNPNLKGKKKDRRIVANMIFQGSRELMHRLAYGDQKVDIERGADNSHITRNKDIEEWAKDIYNFVAKKYGEDNIVGFYVHLDEVNPHCHCTVLPITPRNKFSWKYYFGSTKEEGKEILTQFHTDLYNEVNKKWGMRRGECLETTGAKHRSTEEYRREAAGLETEIHGLEQKKESAQSELSQIYEEMNVAKRKIKSFETMISNLTKKKDDIEHEIAELKQRLGASADSPDEEIVQRLQELIEMHTKVSSDLERRLHDLDATKKELEQLRTEKDMLLTLKNKLTKENMKIMDDMEVDARSKLSDASLSIMGDGLSKLIPTLTPFQLKTLFGDGEKIGVKSESESESESQMLDTSQLQALAEKAEEVMSCAVLLYFGFVDKATTYAESHGGGGSGPGTGWRKKDDEDDILWARRCVRTAARMIRPSSRSRRR